MIMGGRTGGEPAGGGPAGKPNTGGLSLARLFERCRLRERRLRLRLRLLLRLLERRLLDRRRLLLRERDRLLDRRLERLLERPLERERRLERLRDFLRPPVREWLRDLPLPSGFRTRLIRDINTADGFLVPRTGPSSMIFLCKSCDKPLSAASALESMPFSEENLETSSLPLCAGVLPPPPAPRLFTSRIRAISSPLGSGLMGGPKDITARCLSIGIARNASSTFASKRPWQCAKKAWTCWPCSQASIR